ncbi:uncharacterized protein N7511_009279 [Penicillium nucicola]|uniref:uncharacterized protein n=1 Tax=Penicillium nucicola TaxID=1850975 RepID=UPI0025458E42|nr:uncharacterized protein N7511_009279 [Penicillium nucicola]KAJ5747583.1 hypothetical protein N7511_009279 [Penicillium nucicola]
MDIDEQSFPLLEMKSSAHAVAAGAFSTIFSAWARPVVDPILIATNKISVRGQTRTKKADFAWYPASKLDGRSQTWPTFVGEVACSEHRRSSVNVAITISVLRDKIMVESWARGHDRPPSPNQKIEIVRHPHPGCSRVSGQLEIQFSDVFGRAKREEESNFILTATDMEEIATPTWALQCTGEQDGSR